MLESASHTTSEEQFLPADDPEGHWTLIEPRSENIEYYADHRDGLWYIRVNDTARTFRIVTAPVATPGRAHWRELIAHRDDVMLEESGALSVLRRAGRTLQRPAAYAALNSLTSRERLPDLLPRLHFLSLPTAPIRTSTANL